MISRDYNIQLIESYYQDSIYDLLEAISLKDNLLYGIFVYNDNNYIDYARKEDGTWAEFIGSVSVKIKAVVDLVSKRVISFKLIDCKINPKNAEDKEIISSVKETLESYYANSDSKPNIARIDVVKLNAGNFYIRQ